MNVYKAILEQNIRRLLSLYNLDPHSLTSGCGDRLYWGWKLSDFANGTMQGGVHALTIAIKLNLVKDKVFVLKVIDAAIKSIEGIRSKNGSLVEAYPNEHSFCVTALVAFDILSAIREMECFLEPKEKKEWCAQVEPLIRFISQTKEDHAIISNHLATAAAAIVQWNALTKANNTKYLEFLERIYQYQSSEGWYREYEGADPGYQTLCVYYLSYVYQETKDDRLKQSLINSIRFLKYFVHPDGSIGGLYGSRNTEVYYPGGIIRLSELDDDFLKVSQELLKGIERGYNILPNEIDVGNFIPLLNSYAAAAIFLEKNNNEKNKKSTALPFEHNFENDFPEAGIFIKSTEKYYAIVNYKKGGTLKVFDKNSGLVDIDDGGLFGVLKNGVRFSTQHRDESLQFTQRKIMVSFFKTNESYPTPFQMMILRFLSMSIFHSVSLGNIFKKGIVKHLMTKKEKLDGFVIRKFIFLENKITVVEEIKQPQLSLKIEHLNRAKAIHMASSGYYHKQMQDLSNKSRFVEFTCL